VFLIIHMKMSQTSSSASGVLVFVHPRSFDSLAPAHVALRAVLRTVYSSRPHGYVFSLQVSSFYLVFPFAPQPAGDSIVVHNVVSYQIRTIVKEHDAPVQMHADFIRPRGQFSQPQSTMPVRISESCGHVGDCLSGFRSDFRREFVCRFPDSFR
jgi:hypothetical protein